LSFKCNLHRYSTGYLVVKHEGTFGLYKGLSASLMVGFTS
jgi:hypothetical protein